MHAVASSRSDNAASRGAHEAAVAARKLIHALKEIRAAQKARE